MKPINRIGKKINKYVYIYIYGWYSIPIYVNILIYYFFSNCIYNDHIYKIYNVNFLYIKKNKIKNIIFFAFLSEFVTPCQALFTIKGWEIYRFSSLPPLSSYATTSIYAIYSYILV